MRHFHTLSLLGILLFPGSSLAQLDVTKLPVVYQLPGMDKVIIKKDLVFKTVNDTALHYDLYYPPGFDEKSIRSVVIFNNGVGSLDLPHWRVYEDWAKLVAVSGMIAVTHQSRNGRALKDSEDLLDYLQSHAARLKMDKDRMGIWACSGNVSTGLPLAMQENRKYIRGLVLYYGLGRSEDQIIKRQDLDMQLVRAGLDFHALNQGFETFVQKAMEMDAHFEYINYPEGQHAFDVMDDTERSREIIKSTLTFFQTKLSPAYPPAQSWVLTNRRLWTMILNERRTTEALTDLKSEMTRYRAMPNHTPWFNHLIDERNLNLLGYRLIQDKRFDESIQVLAANQEAFPNSANVYDALGDAYEAAGNKTKAIEYSRVALEKLSAEKDLDENRRVAIRESAEGKLRRLEK